MQRSEMVKEIIKFHTSVGRVIKTDEEWNNVSIDIVENYYDMLGIEPIPKNELIKFYEDIASSELGYTIEDKNNTYGFVLNTFSAWASFHRDIEIMGTRSANYGKDFKVMMAEKYEEVKNTFI